MSLGSCSCHLQLIQTTALVWERMLTHAAHITQAWRMSQSGALWRRCLPGLRSGPRPRVLISSPRTRPWSETLVSSIQSSGDKRQTESFYAHDNNLIFRKANIISLRASMTSSCTLSGLTFMCVMRFSSDKLNLLYSLLISTLHRSVEKYNYLFFLLSIHV